MKGLEPRRRSVLTLVGLAAATLLGVAFWYGQPRALVCSASPLAASSPSAPRPWNELQVGGVEIAGRRAQTGSRVALGFQRGCVVSFLRATLAEGGELSPLPGEPVKEHFQLRVENGLPRELHVTDPTGGGREGLALHCEEVRTWERSLRVEVARRRPLWMGDLAQIRRHAWQVFLDL